jgi:hypothetical protein
LGPVEVEATEITNEGLRFDRQYVLVKLPKTPGGLAEHITIKSYFHLGLFKTEIDTSWSKLTIKHMRAESNATITLPLTPSPLALFGATTYPVSIFGTKAIGIDMGEKISNYFSQHMGFTIRLLYIGGNGHREIPGAVFVPKHYESLTFSANDKLQPQRIRFADAAPLLITSTASEEDARRRLPLAARGEDVIVRFRPNIHVDVGMEQKPYEEDSWNMLAVHSQTDPAQKVSVRCLFRTTRCLSLNADLSKGGMVATPQQLYGLLMKDRRVNEKFPRKHSNACFSGFCCANLRADKPVFGQYACAGPSGAVLRVGDEVKVTERISKPQTPLVSPTPTPTTPISATPEPRSGIPR